MVCCALEGVFVETRPGRCSYLHIPLVGKSEAQGTFWTRRGLFPFIHTYPQRLEKMPCVVTF